MIYDFEPLQGKRWVKVTDRRTKEDWAECVRFIVEELYPKALKLTIVIDNLNTHSRASLYACFEPEKAKGIADRLDIQYMPKHGSWLRQCLNRRIPSREKLIQEVSAWESARNEARIKCNWQFTTSDARIKLKKTVSSIEMKIK